jgi:hypothetical protein
MDLVADELSTDIFDGMQFVPIYLDIVDTTNEAVDGLFM